MLFIRKKKKNLKVNDLYGHIYINIQVTYVKYTYTPKACLTHDTVWHTVPIRYTRLYTGD